MLDFDKGVGYVYLLHAEGTNNFKIGYSTNPTQRKKTLDSQSPLKLNLIKSYRTDSAYKDEQKLHRMFAHRRLHGEWFNFESVNHAKELINEFFRMKIIKSIADANDSIDDVDMRSCGKFLFSTNDEYDEILNLIESENEKMYFKRNTIFIGLFGKQAIIKSVIDYIGNSKRLEKAFCDYLGYPVKLIITVFTKNEINIVVAYKNEIDRLNKTLKILS